MAGKQLARPLEDSVSIEVDGIDQLLHDLGAAPAKLIANGTTALTVNAHKVKDTWREADSGLQHAPAYPASVTYDLAAGGGYVEAEIGPDKDRPQGALGNLIEYGSANNPPRGSGAKALAANADDLEHGIALAAESAW
jgi:hypothetical protein